MRNQKFYESEEARYSLSEAEQQRLTAQLPLIPQAKLAEWQEMIGQLSGPAWQRRTLYRWVMGYQPEDTAPEISGLLHDLQKLSNQEP